MFLGGCQHTGISADQPVAAYRRLSVRIPADRLDLHACVATPTGLRVLDACPSAEVFASFSGGSDVSWLNASVGLSPAPIEPLGEVLRALLPTPADLAVRS